jgi:hypothetical protein
LVPNSSSGALKSKNSREEIECVASAVIDAIVAVHRTLGPGLLESTYQVCLRHELGSRGIEVDCELELPAPRAIVKKS